MLRRHRASLTLVVALLAAGLVVLLVYFQPQKLFLNERRDETLPLLTVTGSPGIPGGSPTADRVLRRGDLRSLEHQSTGQVLLIDLADGRRLLRFEALETSNGPDLRVYLSATPASSSWYGYDRDFVDLGPLKGNQGNQNYAVPASLDITRYPSAVIWCKRFSVGFAVATLAGSSP
jgi:electron transfer DM13